MRRIIGIIFVLLLIISAYVWREDLYDWYVKLSASPVPSAEPYPSTSALATPRPSLLPTEVNLDIPFVSQAPRGVWDADHEEFCEEASALMVVSYVLGDRSVTNVDVADARLQEIKARELSWFGYFKDTTAAETARIIREYFGVAKVQVITKPTEQQIRTFLAQGRAVIVPAAGRQLGNPYFTAPGPIYHMLVLKGYTAGGMFIANDPGTRRGANYLYAPAVIMNAIHDWNPSDIELGRKVVIVVG